MPNQVPGTIRQARMQALAELEATLAYRYHQSVVPHISEVLVEGLSPVRPGFVQGTDRRYVTVEFPGTTADFNRLIDVQGTSADERCLTGVRVAQYVLAPGQ